MESLRKGILHKVPVIFEKGAEGRVGISLPPDETPDLKNIPDKYRRKTPPILPKLDEVSVVRHYTRLSSWNHSIELGSYPLGSCTMKYNPKINEVTARIKGFTSVHPLQDENDIQGSLELMYGLEQALKQLSGFASVTLQPSAGANGEFTGLAVIKNAIKAKGEGKTRNKILIPDTAHGTNPASVVLNGFEPISITTGKEGFLLAEAVKPHLNSELAGIMITNPNTLGIYESELKEIADLIHQAGGYVYMDGANFNAIMGRVKPANIGVDTMHFNLHKTFSTPHGGGGPGAGPVGVVEELIKYLPSPVIEKTADGKFIMKNDQINSIGKLHPFFGNFSVLVRAYTYILELGQEGLYEVTNHAVLNARYLRSLMEKFMDLPYKQDTLHEAVFSDKTIKKETNITTMDMAKRMLDYGVHPPTVYFPLIVPGAFMAEPTETESKQNIDDFVQIVEKVIKEAYENPDMVRNAPHNTGVRRLNEAYAARKKILRWYPPQKS
jgi:glycine cleavage system P protein (glycine dehydrogenase) subunit 2